MMRAPDLEAVIGGAFVLLALLLVWLILADFYGIAAPCRDRAALVEIRCEHPSHELGRDGLLWTCRCAP